MSFSGDRLFLPAEPDLLFTEEALAGVAARDAAFARSLCRASHILLTCAFALSPELKDRIRARSADAAVYCAVDHSTPNQNDMRAFLEAPGEDLAKRYKAHISPKWGLKASLGLVASSLSIQLDAQGGVHTFAHSRWACEQALEQAKLDLESGRIEIAIVGAVASAEDALTGPEKYAQIYPGRAFREGAAILVAESVGDLPADLPLMTERAQSPHAYGIADPLMQTLLGARR